jgi:hypothetical protein
MHKNRGLLRRRAALFQSFSGRSYTTLNNCAMRPYIKS